MSDDEKTLSVSSTSTISEGIMQHNNMGLTYKVPPSQKKKKITKMQRAAVPALHKTWNKRISHVIIAPIV